MASHRVKLASAILGAGRAVRARSHEIFVACVPRRTRISPRGSSPRGGRRRLRNNPGAPYRAREDRCTRGYLETIRAILEQMNGTLHHHGRLVVGYSGRRSPESAWLIELDQVVPRGETTRDGLRSFLREPKVDVVLIHLDRYPAAAQANMAPGFARASGFEETGAARPAYVVLRRSEVGPAR
jgi:hypothetical protein